MNDLPAIIGAIGLLIGTVFGGIAALDRRRTRLDDEDAAELENYQRWRPRVRRAVVLLRATIANCPEADEPAGVDELLAWPPPDKARPKHSRGEVTADDEG